MEALAFAKSQHSNCVRNCASVIAIAGFAFLAFAPRQAHAASISCTASALQAAAPAGMTIADVPDLNPGLPKTTGGVALIPANGIRTGSPPACLVTGTMVTDQVHNRTTNFGAVLPVNWNNKFMLQGCTGNCGTVFAGLPSNNQLNKGYPVWSTDEGHVDPLSFTDTWSVISPGVPDTPALDDFYYRAQHVVVEQGKKFTTKYYGGKLSRSYFMGCSGGGRDGMVALSTFPSDFDGIIAGDPYFDPRGLVLNSAAGAVAELRSQTAALTPSQFQIAATTSVSQCDRLDGISDGLIQNPQLCHFNPAKDLPKCPNNIPGSQCFTQDQINSLSVMLSAITDERGNVLEPGYPVHDFTAGTALQFWLNFPTPPSNLTGPEPWNNNPAPTVAPFSWFFADNDLKFFVYRDEIGYSTLTTPGFTFQNGGHGPVDGFHAVLPAATDRLIASRVAPGSGSDPRAASSFLGQGRKLILYHGLADGVISPYGTMSYFKELARLNGGYHKLKENARLFLEPGMAHCAGGTGPNNFGQTLVEAGQLDAQHDVLTALEDWVEQGVAPDQLIATKYQNDDPKSAVQRTMPLCPFPAKAMSNGTGNINDAASWTCPRNDRSMLHTGPAGIEAGMLPHDEDDQPGHDKDH
jgi:feruloyl esterase